MSKQIHDRRDESDRRPQVRFRADQDLLDSFDEWVEGSQHDSRSAALRHAMQRVLGGADTDRAPLRPPTDGRLRTAYLRLIEAANAEGIVRHDIAVNELATVLSIRQESAAATIGRLSERGYLRQLSNVYGGQAWKLVSWEDNR